MGKRIFGEIDNIELFLKLLESVQEENVEEERIFQSHMIWVQHLQIILQYKGLLELFF